MSLVTFLKKRILFIGLCLALLILIAFSSLSPSEITVSMPQEGAQLVADQNDEIGWHQNGGSETYLEILLGEFDQSDKQVGDWSIIATNVHRYTNYYFWTPQYYVKNTTGKTYRIMVREQTQSTQFLAGISGNFTVAVPKPREQGLPAYLSHPDYLSTLVPSPIQREVSLLPLFS